MCVCFLCVLGRGGAGLGWGREGAEMSGQLTLETEQEVEVPVSLRCALKVFLCDCSHNSQCS